jgi:peptide-methionine (R)-S-oxide reductase
MAEVEKVERSEQEWRELLEPDRYEVLRRKGTERAFTGALLDNKKTGMYVCAACGNPLFSSDTKFDSGSGWPSFWSPFEDDNVVTEDDFSHGMHRVEVTCAKCGGHLGHVFPDGPRDKTGLRYCINSLSLDFEEAGAKDDA